MKIKNNKKSKKPLVALIVVIFIGIAATFAYMYTSRTPSEQQATPVKEQTKDTQTIPVIKEGESQEQNNTDIPTEESSNSSTTPTKTEGKTPAQYEGEKVDDTPEYNNEQFRIPEESM